ncbi:MAG: hypothetical protein IJV16_00025 [Lachnospiraceae bacterium]|nr:hypothetical protein [Lachnospiraceae bacterium]
MQKIRLEHGEYDNGLMNTYENIAKRAGYRITDSTVFDCTKIDVSENIQDSWIDFYRELEKKEHPELADLDIMSNVMALLLNFGAKVNNSLSVNEVSIMTGFAKESA